MATYGGKIASMSFNGREFPVSNLRTYHIPPGTVVEYTGKGWLKAFKEQRGRACIYSTMIKIKMSTEEQRALWDLIGNGREGRP